MPLMTELQVAPESVLRKTPRLWVAASRTAGWAGATAIDQTGRAPVIRHFVSRRNRLPARAATRPVDLRAARLGRLQGDASTGRQHVDRLLLLPAHAGLDRRVDRDSVYRHRHRPLATAAASDNPSRADRVWNPLLDPAATSDRVHQSLRWPSPRRSIAAVVRAADRHRSGEALRGERAWTDRRVMGGR